MKQKTDSQEPSRISRRKARPRPFLILKTGFHPTLSPGERQWLKFLGVEPPTKPTEETLTFETESDYILYRVKTQLWNSIADPDFAQLLSTRMSHAEHVITSRQANRKDKSAVMSEVQLVRKVINTLTPKQPKGKKSHQPDNMRELVGEYCERFRIIQRDGLALMRRHQRTRNWNHEWLLKALKDHYKVTMTEAHCDVHMQKKRLLPLVSRTQHGSDDSGYRGGTIWLG